MNCHAQLTPSPVRRWVLVRGPLCRFDQRTRNLPHQRTTETPMKHRSLPLIAVAVTGSHAAEVRPPRVRTRSSKRP